jgi:glucose dehydrogenase
MVGGVVYVSTSLSQVAALDAETGKTHWVYDPETWKNGTPSNNGFVHRGVAYWADGEDRRILFGTGDGYLICLNAQTGKIISTFGHEGRIDLTQGLGRNVDRHLCGVSSPPIICRDVVVTGSKVNDVPLVAEMPPGDVRGFDVRTGISKCTPCENGCRAEVPYIRHAIVGTTAGEPEKQWLAPMVGCLPVRLSIGRIGWECRADSGLLGSTPPLRPRCNVRPRDC